MKGKINLLIGILLSVALAFSSPLEILAVNNSTFDSLISDAGVTDENGSTQDSDDKGFLDEP